MRALTCLVLVLSGCATALSEPDASTGCDFGGAWTISARARAAAPSCGDAGAQAWAMAFTPDGGLIINDGLHSFTGTWTLELVEVFTADGGRLDGGFFPRFLAGEVSASSSELIDGGFTSCDGFAGSREVRTSLDAGCSGYWHVSGAR